MEIPPEGASDIHHQELGHRHGAGEVVALQVVAADSLEDLRHLAGFDAFGGNAQVHFLEALHQRGQQGIPVLAVVVHDFHIDFDVGEGILADAGQVGIAAAVVVQGTT